MSDTKNRAAPLLSVKDLATSFFAHSGELRAVRGVSFDVAAGESLGIVGESGSGKSVTARSIMRVLSPPGRIVGGELRFKGDDVLGLGEEAMRRLRGDAMSMVFQDPMTYLNPVLSVGRQIEETILAHRATSRKEAKAKAIELLDSVHIPAAGSRYSSYPHEFSGGMRQRAVIAMALACGPDLVFADEPTTALDVTIQGQILELLEEERGQRGCSFVLITHDLGVVARFCSRIVVMYGGMVMEEGTREDIFYSPAHPYTAGLLSSVPGLSKRRDERLKPIPGSPPSLAALPAGCPFSPRCAYARRVCAAAIPPYAELGPGRRSLCWLHHPDAPKEGNPWK
jgi:oligopeptide transport system ATP-binding protein